jgi:hypothetical protein
MKNMLPGEVLHLYFLPTRGYAWYRKTKGSVKAIKNNSSVAVAGRQSLVTAGDPHPFSGVARLGDVYRTTVRYVDA